MAMGIDVYLIDGTYELFRSYYGAPGRVGPDGREIGAVRGFMASLGSWLRRGHVTHAGIAFDQVIESFRNHLFAGYKTGEGVPPDLMAQFPLAEQAAAALGLCVWPMVEFEADDALATAAAQLDADASVARVLICTPDKDLAQCVRGTRVVRWDRFKDVGLDEAGVQAKYGVPPSGIADWLALVGDTADGIPGLAGFGEKTAALLIARFGRLEDIPSDPAAWDVAVRGKERLAATLACGRDEAILYRRLASLRVDTGIDASLTAVARRGPDEARLRALGDVLGDPGLAERFGHLARVGYSGRDDRSGEGR